MRNTEATKAGISMTEVHEERFMTCLSTQRSPYPMYHHNAPRTTDTHPETARDRPVVVSLMPTSGWSRLQPPRTTV